MRPNPETGVEDAKHSPSVPPNNFIIPRCRPYESDDGQDDQLCAIKAGQKGAVQKQEKQRRREGEKSVKARVRKRT